MPASSSGGADGRRGVMSSGPASVGGGTSAPMSATSADGTSAPGSASLGVAGVGVVGAVGISGPDSSLGPAVERCTASSGEEAVPSAASDAAEIHRLAELLLEPGGHAPELVQVPAGLAGGVGQLVRAEHEQREQQDDKDLTTADVEHGLRCYPDVGGCSEAAGGLRHRAAASSRAGDSVFPGRLRPRRPRPRADQRWLSAVLERGPQATVVVQEVGERGDVVLGDRLDRGSTVGRGERGGGHVVLRRLTPAGGRSSGAEPASRPASCIAGTERSTCPGCWSDRRARGHRPFPARHHHRPCTLPGSSPLPFSFASGTFPAGVVVVRVLLLEHPPMGHSVQFPSRNVTGDRVCPQTVCGRGRAPGAMLGRCPDSPRSARRSASPIVGRRPMRRRTASRRSTSPSASARRASRATSGSPRTAWPCSSTAARWGVGPVGGASRRCPVPSSPTTSRRSRSSTPPSAPISSCRSTSRTRAAAPEVVATAPRRRRRVPAVALPPRSGHGRVLAGALGRGEPGRVDPALTPRGVAGAPRGSQRGGRHRRPQPPPERLDRRTRRARPPVRAAGLRLGRSVRAGARPPARLGDRRRLQRPRRPDGGCARSRRAG